jgi:hypothetical protein
MTEKHDGGPAFPNPYIEADPLEKGMTLRDWFAGQADITGSLAVVDRDICENLCGPAPAQTDTIDLFKWQAKVLATLRYIAADAMLEARK